MRVFPENRAAISGIVTDENGKILPNVTVRLEQNGTEISNVRTNAHGSYRMSVYPVSGQYDLGATSGELGTWKLGLPLHEGRVRTLNLTLKKAISISGTALMLDNATPHVALMVQVVIPPTKDGDEPTVIATTLTDELGKYQFINLKPGAYQVRCYTLNGFVYYQSATNVEA